MESRIYLRHLEKADLQLRVDLLNDIEIAPYINTKEKFNFDKTIAWFQKIKDDNSRADFVFLHSGKIVGMGGITNISTINKNCELYMYMNPNSQGKGFGYLSCIELCKRAFEIYKLEKVYLYTFAENIRANRLYEKVGFKLEGVLRKHTFKDNELKDRHIYGILKEEIKNI